MDLNTSKLPVFNTIALWILVLIIGGWLIFKPDNTLNADTVKRLTVVVDKLSVASENMNKVANEQRNWYISLQQSALDSSRQRDGDYKDLYGKYGYDESKNNPVSLDDIYSRKLRQQADDNGSGNIRPVENRDSKTGDVQKHDSEPKR